MDAQALYREKIGAEWREVEIVSGHPNGLVLREVGPFFPGVWIASLDQVRVPGPILELREPWGNARKAA